MALLPPFEDAEPDPEPDLPVLLVFDGPVDEVEDEEEEDCRVGWGVYPPLLPAEPSRGRITTREASRHTCCNRYIVGPLVVLLLALVVVTPVVALAVVVLVVSPNNAGENSGPHPRFTDRGAFSKRYFNSDDRSSGSGRKTSKPATKASMAVMPIK